MGVFLLLSTVRLPVLAISTSTSNRVHNTFNSSNTATSSIVCLLYCSSPPKIITHLCRSGAVIKDCWVSVASPSGTTCFDIVGTENPTQTHFRLSSIGVRKKMTHQAFYSNVFSFHTWHLLLLSALDLLNNNYMLLNKPCFTLKRKTTVLVEIFFFIFL